MIQDIFILVLFTAAVTYLGRLVYKSFQQKSGCATGCGKCSAVDFSKLEKELREKGI
jgi:hypothetical protein